MSPLRAFFQCASALLGAIALIGAGVAQAQTVWRLPEVDHVSTPIEQVPPGMVPGQPPPDVPAGLVPADGFPLPVLPPKQGLIAMAFGPSSNLPWSWQFLPDGLIYRSYLAGVKEPRFASVWSHRSGSGAPPTDNATTLWDVTLGGRVGVLRYGTPNAYRPEGFQIDLEGAAEPRLDPLALSTPLISTDYRFGLPITYGRGRWQFKTGYYHLSSHLGDEFMQLNPGFQRINYVRDSVMLGIGYFWTDNLRLFGEFDYAVGVGGGSQPVELQWGADYSPAKPGGAPFAALYGNMRQELNYGGFVVVQAGWQWRGGLALHTFRLGMEYVNGKSTHFEFFNQFEQRIGFGLWYDY
ncbi:MAG: DUF1207 domain-containing protein [Planctomycetia bacterium]|nr:DUF1207 domain-containing protein [Planctomycetia bacterium]